MLKRIRKLKELKRKADEQSVKVRMFALTNARKGSKRSRERHDEYARQYNELRFTFQHDIPLYDGEHYFKNTVLFGRLLRMKEEE